MACASTLSLAGMLSICNDIYVNKSSNTVLILSMAKKHGRAICKAMETLLKEALVKEGVASKRYVQGIDFSSTEIAFLKAVYFPFLLKKGYTVRHGSEPTDCTSCTGLCMLGEKGWYVVSLQ
jgi:hypothetical protein